MNWVGICLALVQGLAALIAWARERELIHEGEQQAIAAAMRKQADDLAAVRASDAAVDAAASDSGRLHELEDRWTRGH